jgi:hypothetical protein
VSSHCHHHLFLIDGQGAEVGAKARANASHTAPPPPVMVDPPPELNLPEPWRVEYSLPHPRRYTAPPTANGKGSLPPSGSRWARCNIPTLLIRIKE